MVFYFLILFLGLSFSAIPYGFQSIPDDEMFRDEKLLFELKKLEIRIEYQINRKMSKITFALKACVDAKNAYESLISNSNDQLHFVDEEIIKHNLKCTDPISHFPRNLMRINVDALGLSGLPLQCAIIRHSELRLKYFNDELTKLLSTAKFYIEKSEKYLAQ